MTCAQSFKSHSGSRHTITMAHLIGSINMGPALLSQRKCKAPQYSRDRLFELQQRLDDLEAQSVFRRPEDNGITAE